MVARYGGEALIDAYNGSLYDALCAIYPQHQWNPKRFTKKESFDDFRVRKGWFDRVGKELGVNQLDDWYKIQRYVQSGLFNTSANEWY